MDSLLHLSIFICIYSILAQSLSLVSGHSGQISLAHAGFHGIGAYTTALLSVSFGMPPLVNLVLAMLLSGILAFVVAKVAVNTVDDYFVIITLGIQVVIFSIMNNWESVTNGPKGIRKIPPFSIFGHPLEDKVAILVLSAILVALVWLVLHRIVKSPFGRMLRAISEDEVYAGSLGKNVRDAKVVAFVISGMLASIAGVLFAHPQYCYHRRNEESWRHFPDYRFSGIVPRSIAHCGIPTNRRGKYPANCLWLRVDHRDPRERDAVKIALDKTIP